MLRRFKAHFLLFSLVDLVGRSQAFRTSLTQRATGEADFDGAYNALMEEAEANAENNNDNDNGNDK